MHKILIHGAVIIKNALLPVGELSKEAAKARNKYFRLYHQDFERKFSTENNNKNIFNRLLLTSDPFRSSIRKVKGRRMNSFLPKTIALSLLAKPNVRADSSESDKDEH